MESTIKLIESEIQEVNHDTNRGIKPISLLLIELAKHYGELKRDYKKFKTSYELNTVIQKDIREEQLKKDDKKITDAELNRYAFAALTKDYQEMWDKAMEIEYLEPILNAFKDYVNAIKFDARETISAEKLFNGSA